MTASKGALGLTTFVAGALLGLAASAWTGLGVPDPIVASPLSSTDASGGGGGADTGLGDATLLVAELRELADAVRANTQALSGSPRRAAATDDGAGPDGAEQRLEALLANALARAASPGTSRRERVPTGKPTRDATSLALLDPEVDFDDHLRTLSHDHLLWSYEDVIEAYGKPDHMVATDAGVRWRYSASEKGRVPNHTFCFVDGVVVAVQ